MVSFIVSSVTLLIYTVLSEADWRGAHFPAIASVIQLFQYLSNNYPKQAKIHFTYKKKFEDV